MTPDRRHHNSRYRTHNGRTHIDINLRHIDQLFDSLDPSPFLERDLDDKAAEYIVSAVSEHPIDTPLTLTIHISHPEEFKLEPTSVVEAIHRYFQYNSELVRKKLRQLLRQGRFTLAAGMLTLFTCLTISQSIEHLVYIHRLIRVIREGLVIIGWVAMWRPIDIFLYSWYPTIETRRIHEKLSKIPVEIKLVH